MQMCAGDSMSTLLRSNCVFRYQNFNTFRCVLEYRGALYAIHSAHVTKMIRVCAEPQHEMFCIITESELSSFSVANPEMCVRVLLCLFGGYRLGGSGDLKYHLRHIPQVVSLVADSCIAEWSARHRRSRAASYNEADLSCCHRKYHQTALNYRSPSLLASPHHVWHVSKITLHV